MLEPTRRLALSTFVAASCLCSQPPRAAADDGRHAANITLPQDDAPHRGQQVEWWYYTAHLFASDGKRYGMQLVFFQFPTGAQTLGSATTFAITDLNGSTPRFVNESCSQPNGFNDARARIDLKLDTSLNGDPRHLSARGQGGQERLAANLAGYAIDLELHAQKPAALHGDEGLVAFPSGTDLYYSRTRIDVRGSLSVGGRQQDVMGVAWFDHQYGVQPAVSWSWFSVQLDSREELMVYRWVTPGGDRSDTLATFVPRGGKVHNLSGRQVELTELESWTSPRSANTYGSRWRIQIAEEQLDLTVTARRPDSEIWPDGQLPYIEADSDVSGSRDGKAVRGYAFAEQVFFPNQQP